MEKVDRDIMFRCPDCGRDESMRVLILTRLEDGSLGSLQAADFDNYKVGECRGCGASIRMKHALVGAAHSSAGENQ